MSERARLLLSLSLSLSVRLYVCQSVTPVAVCLSRTVYSDHFLVRRSACLYCYSTKLVLLKPGLPHLSWFVHFYIQPLFSLTFFLSFCLAFLSVYLSVYLSVFLPVCVFLSVVHRPPNGCPSLISVRPPPSTVCLSLITYTAPLCLTLSYLCGLPNCPVTILVRLPICTPLYLC
jgi:hypothetical protein